MNISVLHTIHGRFRTTLLAGVVTVFLFLLASAVNCRAEKEEQILFPTPEEAIAALVDAAKADNLQTMRAILGPGSQKLVSSGDNVADKAGRTKFVTSYEQKHSLQARSVDTMMVQIGVDDWSMPIPIIKKGTNWGFDLEKGREEILNRRIGRNELQVIDVIDAYVAAQHEYACKDYSGSGKVEFAQRFISTPGSHDGLYWEAKENEPQSPLGPLLARAAREGYSATGNLFPFHGYYFRILKGQGPHAEGGPYDYVAKGKMILGFALLAYPAEYGNSGVMTFLVNQEGIIFEKNLGKETRQLAEELILFNPDQSWKQVQSPDKIPLEDGSCPEKP